MLLKNKLTSMALAMAISFIPATAQSQLFKDTYMVVKVKKTGSISGVKGPYDGIPNCKSDIIQLKFDLLAEYGTYQWGIHPKHFSFSCDSYIKAPDLTWTKQEEDELIALTQAEKAPAVPTKIYMLIVPKNGTETIGYEGPFDEMKDCDTAVAKFLSKNRLSKLTSLPKGCFALEEAPQSRNSAG